MKEQKPRIYDPKILHYLRVEDPKSDDNLFLAINVRDDGSLFFNFSTLLNPNSHCMLGDLTLDKEAAKRLIEYMTVED